VFGLYAALSGAARFFVEELRINNEVLVGLTAPQLWSLALVAIGAALLIRERKRPWDSLGVTESRGDNQGAASRITETSST
jgi:phosphatidylglycerol:prolipoprotein diacylglycerol transferase